MTTAVGLSILPFYQVGQQFTNAGVVLNGGLIYTYLAGTTTPVTTYTDITGTTPNANPIVLSSTGRLVNEIWLPNGTVIKVKLTDSLNNALETKDNLPGIPVNGSGFIQNSSLYNIVNASNYVTQQLNTGGWQGGAAITSGSNLLTISPGPFSFTAAMVGSNIAVTGAFAGSYTTIATYISPTQVTTTANASATQTLASGAVWNSGQDDTVGIAATLNAAAYGAAIAYFPARVYIYNAETANPAALMGIIGDGANQTFFVAKTSSVQGNVFNITNMPPGFNLGADGRDFNILGPGERVPIHQTSFSVVAGVGTAVVDTSQTAIVGQVYEIVGARGANTNYNYTYWKITSSSSSGWTGTPIYWDLNPGNGAVSSVASDGAGNITVLENNPYRRPGYTVSFYGLSSTAGLLMNGNTYSIKSQVFSGSNIIGYILSGTVTSQGATGDSGTATNMSNSGGVLTDNFASYPDWNGVRMCTNIFPNSTHIVIHPRIGNIEVHSMSGSGIKVFTPNYGKMGSPAVISCAEGIVYESTYETTGFFSNPSAWGGDPGIEIQGCTLTGLRLVNSGGVQMAMPGIGGCGIGVLIDGGNGISMSSNDVEAMTPWAVDSTLYPGNNIEVRGNARGCTLNLGYISFNSSTSQIGVYLWENSTDITTIGGSFFLAGSNVQPTNQIYVAANCVDCAILKPHLITGHETAWTNLSQTSVIWIFGDYHFGGANTNVFSIENGQAAVNGTNHSSPKLQVQGTYWDGSQSQTDDWIIQNGIGSGTNPATTLTISRGGSTGGTSGNQSISLTAPNGVNITGATLTLTNTGAAVQTITGTTVAQSSYISSTDSQEWHIGYTQANAAFTIFDSTGSTTRLSIANSTGALTITGNTTVTGTLKATGASSSNGATPPTQLTGWGTPVGYAVVNNYNITDAGGANSNTNKTLAQVVKYLKDKGDFGA